MTDQPPTYSRFQTLVRYRKQLRARGDELGAALLDEIIAYAEHEHTAREAAEARAEKAWDDGATAEMKSWRNERDALQAITQRVRERLDDFAEKDCPAHELVYELERIVDPIRQPSAEPKIELSYDDLIVEVIPALVQAVNENDRGIRITHKASGITVESADQRSQLMNRAVALTVLRVRLAEQGNASSAQKLLRDIFETPAEQETTGE